MADGFLVATTIEGIEVEISRGFGLPEAKEVHGLGAVAGNGDVVGNADDFAVIHPLVAGLARGIGHSLDPAVNRNFLDVLGPDDFPG